jgi:Asp-tRNA(Asn)/Glu-tRNA(Gln) amidotransferase A subunit family amidase
MSHWRAPTSKIALVDMPARDLVGGMRSGELRATAIVEAFLQRIVEREPTVKAWAWLNPEQALRAAASADALFDSGSPLGALHGLPVGVKDIFDTFDMPTEFGTPIHKGRRPEKDAVMVARLRQAGAIVVGKTVTAEFAVYSPGPTRNPHDLARTPGGSSSGSAAAVAAGMAPVALASQTNGSVIRPASFCGVVGYKPSLGLLPRTGMLQQADLLDQPGIMARNVADAAFLAETMMGRHAEDALSSDLPARGLTQAALAVCERPALAFVRGPFWNRAGLEARQGIESFVGALGDRIETIELPDRFAAAEDALSRIMSFGVAEAYRDDFLRAGAGMSDALVRIIRHGQAISTADFLEARAIRDRLKSEFDSIVARYQAVVTLPAVGIAPPFAEGTGDPIFSTVWSLMGAPAITLPLLKGAGGMPIGVQLVGRARDDFGLVSAAGWVERAFFPRPRCLEADMGASNA